MAKKRRISSGNTFRHNVFRITACAAFYLASVVWLANSVAAENSSPVSPRSASVKVGATTSQPAAKSFKSVVEPAHAAISKAVDKSTIEKASTTTTTITATTKPLPNSSLTPSPATTVTKTVLPAAKAATSAPAVSAAKNSTVPVAPTKTASDKSVLNNGAADKPVTEKSQSIKPAVAKPANAKEVNEKADVSSKGKGEVSDKPKVKEKDASVKAYMHPKTHSSSLLVPPPPPDTPTMIPSYGGEEASGLMPMEYMSPELLKKRKQDLIAQLEDAKSEAKKKAEDADSIKLKGKQFKTLFEEGVISKRELETAEKEASEVDSSINRAQLRVSELQTLLDGVSARVNQVNKKSSKSVQIKKYTYTKTRKAR